MNRSPLIYLFVLLLSALGMSLPAASAEGKPDPETVNKSASEIVTMLDKAEYANAEQALRKLLTDAKKLDNKQLELESKVMLGQVLVLAGNAEEGYDELSSALNECASLDEEQYNLNGIKSMAYNGLGMYFYSVRGNYYLGKEYFLKASDVAAKANDDRLARRFETNLVQAAIIERDTTFLKSSRDLYDWAIEHDDPNVRYTSACQLAQLYSFTGNHSDAEKMLRDAEVIGNKTNEGDKIPFYLSKADTYEWRGDYAETERVLDQAAASLGSGNEAKYYQSVIGSRKTGMLLAAGRYDAALAAGLQALSTSLKLNQKTHVGKILLQISQVYEGLGDKANALKYARRYEQFKDSTYSQDRDFMIRSTATIYNVERKEREAEYAKAMFKKERERNIWLLVSIILFAVAAAIAVVAYIHKSRLHRKLVSLYQEMSAKEKDLLR